jgi:hypothetical protein
MKMGEIVIEKDQIHTILAFQASTRLLLDRSRTTSFSKHKSFGKDLKENPSNITISYSLGNVHNFHRISCNLAGGILHFASF